MISLHSIIYSMVIIFLSERGVSCCFDIFSVRRGSCDFKDLTSNVPQQPQFIHLNRLKSNKWHKITKENVLVSGESAEEREGKMSLTFARKTGNKCCDYQNLSDLLSCICPVSSSCFKDSAYWDMPGFRLIALGEFPCLCKSTQSFYVNFLLNCKTFF